MRAIRSGSATKYDGRPPVESQGRLRVSRHMNLISIGVLVTSLVAGTGLAADSQVIDLSHSRLVDLTHAYNAQTIYWPTAATRFSLEKLAYGPAPGGYFYASYSFSTPEHGGTHLDAPLHFSERGQSTDQVPLDRLIAPAVVIDVSSRAEANPDYRLSADDVRAFERQHGQIRARDDRAAADRVEPPVA